MCHSGVRLARGLGWLFMMMVVAGCVGSGDVLYLDVRAIPLEEATESDDADAGGQEQFSVFVEAFEDQRAQKEYLGVQTHLGGGVTIFDVDSDRPGEVVARVLADYMRQRGWVVGLETPGVSGLSGNPDVIVSGQVREFSVRVKSRFGSTVITTSLALVLKAKHTADGSTTKINLDDTREQTVASFDPEDLEVQVNQMLKQSLERFMSDLQAARGALRRR